MTSERREPDLDALEQERQRLAGIIADTEYACASRLASEGQDAIREGYETWSQEVLAQHEEQAREIEDLKAARDAAQGMLADVGLAIASYGGNGAHENLAQALHELVDAAQGEVARLKAALETISHEADPLAYLIAREALGEKTR